MKSKLLLHVCCAPCAGNLLKELSEEFEITAYFYNPNLDSLEEHEKRWDELEKYADKLGITTIKGNYNKVHWLELVKGLEQEPEGGKRCVVCYQMRLEEIARLAQKKSFDYFGTTLTISPYKRADVINPIGIELGNKYHLKFLTRDFKKADGFKKSCLVSKNEGFYRQDYCGCEFSKRN